MLDQIAHAIAIAPFVVVPAHELEEALVQLDTGAGVVDGRSFRMDEVGADHFVVRVFKNALEVSLAGFFERGGDFLVARFLDGAYGLSVSLAFE